ncbi:MAG: CopM family metallochaperone [Bauldia sp.]
MRIRSLVAFGAILIVPVVAVAQMGGMGGMGGMNMDGPMLPAGGATPATTAFMDAHAEMMANMNIQLTGNPDRDFALMMIPHHQGAIAMAQVELEYGTDPDLRAMAQAIIDAQQAEITTFEAWLAAHP